MKVLHLIKATRISGAERHLLILLKTLRDRDIDAHLLIMEERNTPMMEYEAQAQARGIPVERIVIGRGLDVRVVNRIRKKLIDLQPTILHTHLIHADTFGLAAARLAGVKTVITSRHNDDTFRSRPLIKQSNNVLWRGFKAGIVISDAIRQFAVETEGAPEDKLHVVRYGIEHTSPTDADVQHKRQALRQELDLPNDALIIGMACRLTEQKGVPYALDAFAQIAETNPNTYLVIAGDGELRDQLQDKAFKLHLEDRVIFLGWREDMLDVMAAYDIFLLPSLWEGFGLVFLEAMSKRLPIVATNVSAIPEVVKHQETGLLVPPKDSTAIASAIQSLLDDRTVRLHMGLLGEARLEQHFNAERMAEETIAVYQQFAVGTRGEVKKKVSIE